MSHRPGKFTWFEHLSGDPAKARAFYEGLFGWKVKGMPMGTAEYGMIHHGEQAIGGVLAVGPGTPNHWASWMSVRDVDASYAAALAAGAQPVMAPRDFPGMGRGATLIDPVGARVSLWRGTQGDRDDVEHVPAGDWVWNELGTVDARRALAFYENVFGYTHDEMDMGAQGTYYVLKGADGVARGGIMQSTDASLPAMWMPYVRVEDANATAARVGPLGGKLAMAPRDIADVGRIGMLLDPLGAALGFIRPAVRP
jgi:uncharacterized protein